MPITDVSLSLENGLSCQIFTKSHIVAADDPPEVDAEDEGPTPLEFFLAALGASAAMAIKEEAADRGLEVEEVQVNVSWRTTHRRLLAGDEPLPSTPIRRETRVRVAHDISEIDRDALLARAKASPIDRALAGGVAVEDALFVLGYAGGDP